MRAMSNSELQKQVIQLFQLYNHSQHLQLLNSFKDYQLTEHQFAQLIGKARLYQYLPAREKKQLPALEFTDSHLNVIARNYYKDEHFNRNNDCTINLWDVYNLFTGANKTSYIDSFLNRGINATDFIFGLANALRGKNNYQWFLE